MKSRKMSLQECKILQEMRANPTPKKVVANTLEAMYVEIWLNGEKSDRLWTEVNAQEGYGLCLIRTKTGFEVEGDEFKQDRIEGDFEIKWKENE